MKGKDRRKQPTPEICPVCGEDVPRGALACAECGADHKSGWRSEAEMEDGLGLADDEFDYEEFIRSEFGGNVKPTGLHPLWWITAMVLIIAFAALYFYTR